MSIWAGNIADTIIDRSLIALGFDTYMILNIWNSIKIIK